MASSSTSGGDSWVAPSAFPSVAATSTLHCTPSGGIGNTKPLEHPGKILSRKFPWSGRTRRTLRLTHSGDSSTFGSTVSFELPSSLAQSVSSAPSPHQSPRPRTYTPHACASMIPFSDHSGRPSAPSHESDRPTKTRHLRQSQSWSTLSNRALPAGPGGSGLPYLPSLEAAVSSTRYSKGSTQSSNSTCSGELTRPTADSSLTSASSFPGENSSVIPRKQLSLKPSVPSMLKLLKARRGGSKQVAPGGIDSDVGSSKAKTDGAKRFKSYPSLPNSAGILPRINQQTPSPLRNTEGCLLVQPVSPPKKFLHSTQSCEQLGSPPMSAIKESSANRLNKLSKPRARGPATRFTGMTCFDKPPATTPLSSDFLKSPSFVPQDDLDVGDARFMPLNHSPIFQCKRWAVIDVFSPLRDAMDVDNIPSSISSGSTSHSDSDSYQCTLSRSPSIESRFSYRSSFSSRDPSPSYGKYPLHADLLSSFPDEVVSESRYEEEVDDELENAQVMTGSRIVCFNSALKHVRCQAIHRSLQPSSQPSSYPSHPPNLPYQEGIPSSKGSSMDLSQLVELYHGTNAPENHDSVKGPVVHEIGCAI